MVEEGVCYALCLDKLINTKGDSSLCFRPPGQPGDGGHGSGVENVFQSGGKVFGSGAGATCAAGRLNMKKSEQPS